MRKRELIVASISVFVDLGRVLTVYRSHRGGVVIDGLSRNLEKTGQAAGDLLFQRLATLNGLI